MREGKEVPVVLVAVDLKVAAEVLAKTAHAVRVAQATAEEAALAAAVVRGAKVVSEGLVAMAVQVAM